MAHNAAGGREPLWVGGNQPTLDRFASPAAGGALDRPMKPLR